MGPSSQDGIESMGLGLPGNWKSLKQRCSRKTLGVSSSAKLESLLRRCSRKINVAIRRDKVIHRYILADYVMSVYASLTRRVFQKSVAEGAGEVGAVPLTENASPGGVQCHWDMRQLWQGELLCRGGMKNPP